MYNKNSKDPNINPWETVQYMVPSSKKGVLDQVKKTLFWDKSETIFLFYLKNFYEKVLCPSFWLLKFCDFGCNSFEGRLKSYLNLFHFQHRSKFCKLIKTNMYLWNDLLWLLSVKCTAVHFFEDNPTFDHKLIYLSPSILKVTEK